MLYFPTVREAKERQESVAEGTSGTTGLADDGKININTADAAQLMQIPGIGESRAEAILSYRRENGSFSSVEDIMKVSGIKNALFEKMKDYITV
jgi:competence protein ComEA